MTLKYIPLLLCIIISLQAGDLSRKRKREEIATISNLSWARHYRLKGKYKKSLKCYIEVMRSNQNLCFEQIQNGKKVIITKSKEDLRAEFAIVSLMRHFKHQLKYNNPNACHASIYHRDGEEHLLEIENHYIFDLEQEQKCLLSAVNLGNIARAEGRVEDTLACYQCIAPNLSPLEQFSLFAIGYPLILDCPIKTKSSNPEKLLQLTLKENDFYVQTFKELYATNYDEAFAIVMDKN